MFCQFSVSFEASAIEPGPARSQFLFASLQYQAIARTKNQSMMFQKGAWTTFVGRFALHCLGHNLKLLMKRQSAIFETRTCNTCLGRHGLYCVGRIMMGWAEPSSILVFEEWGGGKPPPSARMVFNGGVGRTLLHCSFLSGGEQDPPPPHACCFKSGGGQTPPPF